MKMQPSRKDRESWGAVETFVKQELDFLFGDKREPDIGIDGETEVQWGAPLQPSPSVCPDTARGTHAFYSDRKEYYRWAKFPI